jgi:HEAT repeat protein
MIPDRSKVMAMSVDEKVALLKSLLASNFGSELLAEERLTPIVSELLSDENDHVRLGAVLVAGRLSSPDLLQQMRTRLAKDSDPRVRALCAASLHDRTPATIDCLVNALHDSDPYVRASSCRALGEIGDRTATPFLAGLHNDSSWEVRWDAAVARGKLGDASAIEEVAAVLANSQIPAEYRKDLDKLYARYLAGEWNPATPWLLSED